MARVKCRTCSGEYETILADGLRYFHACPPLSDAEVKAALGLPADDDALTPAQRRQLAEASRTRPNARDENVDPTRVVNWIAQPKQAGRGEPTPV